MWSHRLSPFCGLVRWEVFPSGLAVARPPQAWAVTPAARQWRVTRMRLCGGAQGSLMSSVGRPLAVVMETGRFSRLVPTATPHRGRPLSAALIVDPGKVFSNTPGVTFGKTPDDCTCPKRS